VSTSPRRTSAFWNKGLATNTDVPARSDRAIIAERVLRARWFKACRGMVRFALRPELGWTVRSKFDRARVPASDE
jgi:hypothetical protein